MKDVKVIKNFYDLKEKCDREAGEVFPASNERAKDIKRKLPEYVEILEQEPAPAKGSKEADEEE